MKLVKRIISCALSVALMAGCVSLYSGISVPSNITVNASDYSTITLSDGTTLMWGDVDCDGDVDAVDYALVNNYIQNMEQFTTNQLKCADVNLDDKIDSSDAQLILNYIQDMGATADDSAYEEFQKQWYDEHINSIPHITTKSNRTEFEVSRDFWSFDDTSEIFGDTYVITDEHRQALLSGLSATEKEKISEVLQNPWNGSGFGYNALVVLAKKGIFIPSEWQEGATHIADLQPTKEILSLINCYAMYAYSDAFARLMAEVNTATEESKIKTWISALEKDPLALVYFSIPDDSNTTSAIATGIEYGSYTYNNKTYDVKIVTNAIYDDYCIYFNTSDYSWIAPKAEGASSENGAKLRMICTSEDLPNYQSYFSHSSVDAPSATTPQSTTTTTKATTTTTTTTNATTTTTTTTTSTTQATTTTTRATTTTQATTTTTQATTPTRPTEAKFEWGKDNWNFGNSAVNFPNGWSVKPSIQEKMKEEFKPENPEKWNIWSDEVDRTIAMKSKDKWGGSCFGMTVSQIMVKQGNLDLTKYGGINQVNQNEATENMISVINFIQSLQNNSLVSQTFRQEAFDGGNQHKQPEYIQTLVDVLENENCLVNVCYGIERVGQRDAGHSVIAYGVENAEDGVHYSDVTNKYYDKKILIADPVFLHINGVVNDACIYYNSSDYSWVIEYQNYTSKDGTVYHCYWNPEIENRQHGYIYRIAKYFDGGSSLEFESLMSSETTSQYIAGLEVDNVSRRKGEVSEVYDSHESDMDFMGEGGSNVADYILNFDGDFDNTNIESYALWNPERTYRLSYDSPSDFDLKMDYENVIYFANATNSKSITFHPDGCFEMTGRNAHYDIEMLSDSDMMVTDWYSMKIYGTNVNTLTYQCAKNGYILSADNLNDVIVDAHNENVSTRKKFSTNYDNVLIYEIDENTIGISADADGDGNYETPVSSVGGRVGDFDGSGSVDIADVLALNQYLLGINDISKDAQLCVDVNNDGFVSDSDAMQILKSLVGLAKL